PIATAPSMFAELTPTVTQFWSGVVGLNVSGATDCSPTEKAGSSLAMTYVAGAVNPAGTLPGTSARVMLAATTPCRSTAAAAPLGVWAARVGWPSSHVASDGPAVVLLPQLPLPCGRGSW